MHHALLSASFTPTKESSRNTFSFHPIQTWCLWILKSYPTPLPVLQFQVWEMHWPPISRQEPAKEAEQHPAPAARQHWLPWLWQSSATPLSWRKEERQRSPLMLVPLPLLWRESLRQTPSYQESASNLQDWLEPMLSTMALQFLKAAMACIMEKRWPSAPLPSWYWKMWTKRSWRKSSSSASTWAFL